MSGRARVAAAGVACLLVTSACSTGEPVADPPAAGSSAATPSQTPTSARPSPSVRSEPAEPPRPLTVALAGDIHFEGALRSRLERPATALAPVTRTLAAADLAVVNLETSLGTGGSPEPGKRYTFQAPTTALTALAEAGIDVATLANNHALDFGTAPLPGVFRALADAAGADPAVDVVGIGRDLDDAFRPALTEVRGSRVATLGATVADTDPTADPTGQWAATADSPGTADAIDPRRLLRAVREADGAADVVVVYLHWGVQGERCPSDAQRSLARDLVGAGADVVAGSHSHLLQGDGRLGPGYVAYGLGNYAWYTASESGTPATGVLTLTVQPPRSPAGRARVTEAAWEGAEIGADGLPRVLTGPADEAFDDQVASLRGCAGLTPAG